MSKCRLISPFEGGASARATGDPASGRCREEKTVKATQNPSRLEHLFRIHLRSQVNRDRHNNGELGLVDLVSNEGD